MTTTFMEHFSERGGHDGRDHAPRQGASRRRDQGEGLAAHRTGIRSVILPSRNERDVEEVPEELRRQLRFIFVDDAEEVLRHALTPSPADVHQAAR